MKKVIIKYKISDRDKLEEELSRKGFDFEPLFWLHERVYVPRNYRKNSNFPRLVLRTEVRAVDLPARYEFMLRRHIEDSKVDIVEKVEMFDYRGLSNIVQQLGFQEQTELSMRRQEIRLPKNRVMHLDKIDDREGYYVKIETEIEEGESVQAIREELFELMDGLSVSRDDLVTTSYAEE